MVLFIFFTLILNVVTIALVYYCLSDSLKKEKVIFIAVGIAIIYILTSLVYWISTKDIKIKEVSETCKNLITFLFVPINAIITLPIVAKSYNKYKSGSLKQDKFRNRLIVIGGVLLIILIIECSYFKNIQNGIIKLIEENKNSSKNKSVVVQENDINPIKNIDTKYEMVNVEES